MLNSQGFFLHEFLTEAQDEDTWKDHEEIETATNIAGNDDWWSDFLKVTKVKK